MHNPTVQMASDDAQKAGDPLVLHALAIQSLRGAVHHAATAAEFRALAADIRRITASLLQDGLQPRALTAVISELNDSFTQRLVTVTAQAQSRDLRQACWLAFGSEGREEQTLATDQDNGLIFVSDEPERDRPVWLSFAQAVNQALDDCGFPLCKGEVMARNPACCLTPAEWSARLAHWVDHGTPLDLLAAAVYFDLRPIAGCFPWAHTLREQITRQAHANPRFCRQLADEVLRIPHGLDWKGALRTEEIDGMPLFNLKCHGTAVFVAVARLRSLALGVSEVNTCKRLEAYARLTDVPEHEARSWVTGFEFLQGLRLRAHVQAMQIAAPSPYPNHVRLEALDDLELQMLKETLHVGRRLQQAVELDYHRT